MKARYDHANATLEGVDEGGAGARSGAGATGSTSPTDFKEVAPDDEAPKDPLELDPFGVYFEPSIGHYKLDKRGRRYPVDETGTRKFRFGGGRVTSRPEGGLNCL